MCQINIKDKVKKGFGCHGYSFTRDPPQEQRLGLVQLGVRGVRQGVGHWGVVVQLGDQREREREREREIRQDNVRNNTISDKNIVKN